MTSLDSTAGAGPLPDWRRLRPTRAFSSSLSNIVCRVCSHAKICHKQNEGIETTHILQHISFTEKKLMKTNEKDIPHDQQAWSMYKQNI